MELHQLAYAAAIAEERSFTRAASRLRIAQPSLSRAIKLLEHELGVVLFHRAPGQSRVEVTTEGAALLPFLRRILTDVEATTNEARALTGLVTGRLVIGATPSLITHLLPDVLADYHAAFPGVEIVLVEAGSRILTRHIIDGHIDIAVVVLPIDNPKVMTVPLLEDRLVLALNRDHPLAHRVSVRLRELDQTPLVAFPRDYDLRTVTDQALRRHDVHPLTTVEGAEMDGVLALVAAGLGAAVVPTLAVAPDGPVIGIPLTHPSLRRSIALARRADRPSTHAARELEHRLRDACRRP